jgi:hypothetical protein
MKYADAIAATALVLGVLGMLLWSLATAPVQPRYEHCLRTCQVRVAYQTRYPEKIAVRCADRCAKVKGQ